MVVFVLYLLVELVETIRSENHAGSLESNNGESSAISIILIITPTLAFFFMMLRFLREQMLSMAFYYSKRLFKVLSCGLRSVESFAHNKIIDYEKE